jgi:formate dehydrogenase major subunit
MLVRRYPADAIRRFPDKVFHRAVSELGLADVAAVTSPSPDPGDCSHPYIRVDMTRCIDCYRCVRICDELQDQFVWHVRDRGLDTRIRPDGPTLRESSCVSWRLHRHSCPVRRRSTRAAPHSSSR